MATNNCICVLLIYSIYALRFKINVFQHIVQDKMPLLHDHNFDILITKLK